jgi:hypothetical protein
LQAWTHFAVSVSGVLGAHATNRAHARVQSSVIGGEQGQSEISVEISAFNMPCIRREPRLAL